MKTQQYKGYEIQLAPASHCALIYNAGQLIKCIAGDILAGGKNNRVAKAKLFIGTIANKTFLKWVNSSNVVKTGDNEYKTQCSQYTIGFTLIQLYQYAQQQKYIK